MIVPADKGRGCLNDPGCDGQCFIVDGRSDSDLLHAHHGLLPNECWSCGQDNPNAPEPNCDRCESRHRLLENGRRLARRQKVRLSDPTKPLSAYSREEFFLEAFDEVPS